jgi:hypothetical protein
MRHLMACLSIAWGPIPTAREPDLAVAILPPSKYLLGSKAAERRRGQKYAPTSAPPFALTRARRATIVLRDSRLRDSGLRPLAGATDRG